MNAQNTQPKVMRESKNKIRVDFERTPLVERLKAKFLSTYFLTNVVWYIFRLCLLIGIAIGAWQGFWIAYVGIPPFICTLAGMLVFRGLCLLILNGMTLAPFPEAYQQLSTGFIPDVVEGFHMR